MLLVHQNGSVKVGEVVRYTLTYTPSADRILPTPQALRLRIKNSSPVPLRAAYLHGPYTIHVSAYPSTFHPDRKLEAPREWGIPEYEPQLKAGGSWDVQLRIPERFRLTGEITDPAPPADGQSPKRLTWIIDVASQIIFSSSATVHYEVLVGRDVSSLSTAVATYADEMRLSTGKVEEDAGSKDRRTGRHSEPPRGIFSKAVRLVIDDTASLWNNPPWPQLDKGEGADAEVKMDDPLRKTDQPDSAEHAERGLPEEGKPKRVHLVILTHGLHSNLSADLLYLKESIDATAREVREEARQRRARRSRQKEAATPASSMVAGERQGSSGSERQGTSGSADSHVHFARQSVDRDEDDGDEETIVRGFTENVIRTERGIKYLGKRLAKYILRMTFPQQPFLPSKKSGPKAFASALTGRTNGAPSHGRPAHPHSSLYEQSSSGQKRPYEITSISFIGHSLGGLIQTYAVAYLQKHSPQFFEIIKPINFIAIATPFLGLSNENPLYVKFALDFGLVGRTGQDLGLAWRAPNVARNGWRAFIGGLGAGKPRSKADHASSKPLLRILPTGPAHVALKAFKKRTVYANVVNDGIVPLRTSCLLFLDWNSLDRVEKARRENGLVGTMAEWGWAELMGSKVAAHGERRFWLNAASAASDPDRLHERLDAHGHAEGPPTSGSAAEDGSVPPGDGIPNPASAAAGQPFLGDDERPTTASSSHEFFHALNSFLALLVPNRDKPRPHSTKDLKMYQRSQTVRVDSARAESRDEAAPDEADGNGAPSSAGHEDAGSVPVPPTPGPAENGREPPRTSIFESAGALLSPPLPSLEFLIDPSRRPRTIFHDRVYHPADIPRPAPTRRSSVSRSLSSCGESLSGHRKSASHGDHAARSGGKESSSGSAMTVEEKIARAYHRDMSWRKVLVRIEPDAHNNIIVRRMFANAYGWPVVKHLVDTHFGDSDVAQARDDDEPSADRAKRMEDGVGEDGEEVVSRGDAEPGAESGDTVGALRPGSGLQGSGIGGGGGSGSGSSSRRPTLSSSRQDSVQWSERDFHVTDDDDDDDDDVSDGLPGTTQPWNIPGLKTTTTTTTTTPTKMEPLQEMLPLPLGDATLLGLSPLRDQAPDGRVMAQVAHLASSASPASQAST
ncbi:MAG: hypothetical protein M1826_001289 [Phylliscum demangeonii]|nr:MAG: hypothetical protein M1826_001289 [Phylliscum demangeonii]